MLILKKSKTPSDTMNSNILLTAINYSEYFSFEVICSNVNMHKLFLIKTVNRCWISVVL